MVGYINKLDSFATFEGQGIRYCIFLQGCPLSCVYCHNADAKCFYEMLVDERKSQILCLESSELAKKIIKNKSYYKNGGVTFSGGEPLCQSKYILEVVQLLKVEKLHVAIDTSGIIMNEDCVKLIDIADCFIIDLKFITNADYLSYCGCDGIFDKVYSFIKLCKMKNKEIILRTVVVPNINDSVEKMLEYKIVIEELGLFNCWELLPFHTLGFTKYEQIGEKNFLSEYSALDMDKLEMLKKALKMN